jgi:hypothetical protein
MLKRGDIMTRGQLLSFPQDASSRPESAPAALRLDPDALPSLGPEKAPRLPLFARVLILLGLLGLAAILAPRGDDMAAVPVAERARLYEDTLTSVKAACVPERSWSPREYCAQQLRALTTFPQCDAACRALAQQVGHRPLK